MKITEKIIEKHGLKKEEYENIKKLLNRNPNLLELGIFSAMWNEHCSYKSSKIHLKKLPTKGKQVGLRRTLDWPGYTGWEATPIFQEEIDVLRKEWSIPFSTPGEDVTFVYEDDIIKKPRKPTPNVKTTNKKTGNRTILRKNRKRRS